MQDTQKFYPVKGFEDYYEIARNGDIKRKEGSVSQIYSNGEDICRKVTNKILKTDDSKRGYSGVSISIKGIVSKSFLVHRLVALTFIPNPNSYREVNHINGIKTDNRVENLEWVSRSQNMKHRFDVLEHRGSRAIISDKIVISIFMNGIIAKKGIKGNCTELCKKHNIHPDSFRGIVSGEFYKNVTKNLKRKGDQYNGNQQSIF